jgi:outer membrane immunogenic protein
MRFHRIALAAVAAIGFASVASAADMATKAPAYKATAAVAPYNWTGFYIGTNIGGGWSSDSVTYTPNDAMAVTLFALDGAPPSASIGASGVIGGVQLGYNWQVKPDWLVGVEADLDWSGIKGSAATSNTILGGSPVVTNAMEEKTKWFGTARARLGYLPAPNLLAFVTGGFAYGEVQRTGTYTSSGILVGGPVGGFSFSCTPNIACFSGSTSATQAGWTVGGADLNTRSHRTGRCEVSTCT